MQKARQYFVISTNDCIILRNSYFLNRLVNYCTKKKLLQSFYREILEVNTLIALPEFRFEIPLETSLEASLAADSSQVKVYQLSFGQIIHSEVVSTSDAFVPAPLTTAKTIAANRP